MATTTTLIARIAAPALAVTGLALLVRPEALREAVRSVLDTPALSLTLGIVSLVLGLVVLVLHFRWKGLAEISVTLLGAAMTFRGAALLIIPDFVDWLAAPVLEQYWFFYAAAGACILLAAWFGYLGIQKMDAA